MVKLLPYNKQASSKLFPVGCIITDEKSLLTLSDNELSDVHCDLRYFTSGVDFNNLSRLVVSWIDLGQIKFRGLGAASR